MPPKSTPSGASAPAQFRRRLLVWFRRHGRDLPWRRTRDPYRILVSEVMLQQTQVLRVEAYYERFLKRFPTVSALARARPGRVREAWDGLGYYRRAVNLHRLARTVVRDHEGRIPGDPATLRTLPGIGPYTAGAIASFSFEQAVPAIDTNVARVLRRAFHPRAAGNASGDRTLARTAARLHTGPGQGAWALNQALMELGARVCTARVAHCGRCPVVQLCKSGRKKNAVGDRLTANSSRHIADS